MNSPHDTSIPQTVAPWLGACLGKAESLAGVGANWDSYGAAPIERQSIEHAKQLLMELARNAAIEAPAITATPSGNVGLCWDDGQRSLDVEVHPDGVLRFAYVDEQAPQRDHDGETRDGRRLSKLLADG
ncbi:MAG: hypothetical protein KY475_15980 [Planctomycetes bacterium]|nr:hypothetical protein [Planctomycetota bacterium]